MEAIGCCKQSIPACSFTSLEVVVVDDASTDDTPDRVAADYPPGAPDSPAWK